MTYTLPVVDITRDVKDSLLLPYTIETKWRKVPTPITINNTEIVRYQAPFVTEYIDLSTGEITKAADLRNDPRVPPQIYVGEIMLQRQALMDSLRKEVREFAFFTLQFRNNRRGITPGIDTLVEWYARIHTKRPSNVRRYVGVLQEVGFLAGTSLLSPLFQRTGKTKTTKDHLGEDAEAGVKFLAISIKGKRRSTSKCDHNLAQNLARIKTA
jgi:hypothetical protein